MSLIRDNNKAVRLLEARDSRETVSRDAWREKWRENMKGNEKLKREKI